MKDWVIKEQKKQMKFAYFAAAILTLIGIYLFFNLY